MAGRAVTVIIPTHDHGPLLRSSIESVRNQTVQDFELFVIGDGVPEITREILKEYEAQDKRIYFVDRPKSPRTGEPYRHEVLSQASGRIVCYLADDDLWLPTHLEYMYELLASADFARTMPIAILPDGEFAHYPGDLRTPEAREFLRSGKNFIPLSTAGHTLSFYRRLPYGWRTTPVGTYTDLYMWQQFIDTPGCRAMTGYQPTVLHFPSKFRRDWSIERRVTELSTWEERLLLPHFTRTFQTSVLKYLSAENSRLGFKIESLERALVQSQEARNELQASLADQVQQAKREFEVTQRFLDDANAAVIEWQNKYESREHRVVELVAAIDAAEGLLNELRLESEGKDQIIKEHQKLLLAIERGPLWRARHSILRLPLFGSLLRFLARKVIS